MCKSSSQMLRIMNSAHNELSFCLVCDSHNEFCFTQWTASYYKCGDGHHDGGSKVRIGSRGVCCRGFYWVTTTIAVAWSYQMRCEKVLLQTFSLAAP